MKHKPKHAPVMVTRDAGVSEVIATLSAEPTLAEIISELEEQIEAFDGVDEPWELEPLTLLSLRRMRAAITVLRKGQIVETRTVQFSTAT